MAANTLSFEQISTILNAVNQQATGQSTLGTITTANFVTVAQTTLQTGYDPVLAAISQVLSRTIFSIRPYYATFRGLMVDEVRYGNHVRKLNVADKPFEDDSRLTLVDGQSVDQYNVNKPNILQTNFYGANVYEKSLTVFKDQLDCAFSSAEEFGRFIAMVMQNASDMIEQAHDNMARATVANLIGGKIAGDTGNVLHLLTEYNTLTGLSLTATDIYQPDNFVPFAKWLYSRVNSVSDLLRERSATYHINVTGKTVMRHTPYDRQRMYLNAQFMNAIEATVLSTVFQDRYMRIGEYESVGYWQSIDTPAAINVTPTYLKSDGTLATASDAVSQANILGVIMDEEAAGITTVNQWSASTPFNAKGGYSNIFWHFTDRFWNDFTENCVVLILD